MSNTDSTRPNDASRQANLREDRIISLCVDVENEWQTAQDHIDDSRYEDAEYYLERLRSYASRLQRLCRKLGSGACASQAPSDSCQQPKIQVKHFSAGRIHNANRAMNPGLTQEESLEHAIRYDCGAIVQVALKDNGVVEITADSLADFFLARSVLKSKGYPFEKVVRFSNETPTPQAQITPKGQAAP